MATLAAADPAAHHRYCHEAQVKPAVGQDERVSALLADLITTGVPPLDAGAMGAAGVGADAVLAPDFAAGADAAGFAGAAVASAAGFDSAPGFALILKLSFLPPSPPAGAAELEAAPCG